MYIIHSITRIAWCYPAAEISEYGPTRLALNLGQDLRQMVRFKYAYSSIRTEKNLHSRLIVKSSLRMLIILS